MGPWKGIGLIEVGGSSTYGGLEAEGQEYFTLCLSSFVPQDKLSDPRACPVEWQQAYSTGLALLDQKYRFFASYPHYSITPTFHHSISPAHYPQGQRITQ